MQKSIHRSGGARQGGVVVAIQFLYPGFIMGKDIVLHNDTQFLTTRNNLSFILILDDVSSLFSYYWLV